MAYLSVFEKNSQWVPIQEQKARLQLQLFLCKAEWYLMIPQEFHRNKVSIFFTVVLRLIHWILQKITAPRYEKIKVINFT
jgi:hypothetical protein